MKRLILSLLALATVLLIASPALAYTLMEDFTGATINATDLTTTTGLDQWNDLVRWQIMPAGGNPDSWAQHTPRPDLGPEESLLFYGFDATGLGTGTSYSLNFDFINSVGSFTGTVYIGGLTSGESISRFAPWDDLSSTFFDSYVISSGVNSWTDFGLVNGIVDADYDVLYIAFQMGGTTGLRGIDNVYLQVGPPVPEPATLFLLGVGLLCLPLLRRVRQKI